MTVFRYESEIAAAQSEGPSIFLAGPTHAVNHGQPTTWRAECLEILKQKGWEGGVCVPEFSGHPSMSVHQIVAWEFAAMEAATAILFWIPRTREHLGLTTNCEFGYWVAREPGKVVYGRPGDALACTYLDLLWAKHSSAPIHRQLEPAVECAVALAR